MDPNETLRQIRRYLEEALANRNADRDDSCEMYEAMDHALCLLQWVADGGFQPEQLAYHADKLRELLP